MDQPHGLSGGDLVHEFVKLKTKDLTKATIYNKYTIKFSANYVYNTDKKTLANRFIVQCSNFVIFLPDLESALVKKAL